MPSKELNLGAVRALALKLPDVEEHSTARGTSFRVRGRMMACEAVHKSADPDSLMVRVDAQRRTALIKAAPHIYYVTGHYEKYPALLVRLSQIDKPALREVLTVAWEFEREKAK